VARATLPRRAGVSWRRAPPAESGSRRTDPVAMEALLASLGVVLMAELGDKTQFLSLYLAATYRKPIPILGGIFVATVLSNIVAALFGRWIGAYLTPDILRWVLTLSFIGFAIWALLPERPVEANQDAVGRHGALVGATISFVIAELGDKTQIVTAALAARYDSVVMVTIGATVGMMLANLPAVIGGHYFAGKLPSRWANYIAAVIFLIQAVLTYLGIERI
jgi:Ca2+/H+ antiporter, TMEM165/GDT1 family